MELFSTGDYVRPLTEVQFRKNIKSLFDRYNNAYNHKYKIPNNPLTNRIFNI